MASATLLPELVPEAGPRADHQRQQVGTFSGHSARVGRATTLAICGSAAVRARDVHVNLTGGQAADLALAEDEVRQITGQALADCFNGGTPDSPIPWAIAEPKSNEGLLTRHHAQLSTGCPPEASRNWHDYATWPVEPQVRGLPK